MKKQYPTGVECHGGMLRIWFMYEGVRCRESLGAPDTPKNRKIAGELRQSVMYAIRTGTFDFSEKFPNSPRSKKIEPSMTVQRLFDVWLDVKKYEVSDNSFIRYQNRAASIVRAIAVRVKVVVASVDSCSLCFTLRI